MRAPRHVLLVVSVGLAIPAAGWCADPARRALDEGARYYEQKAYDKAAAAFDQAAQAAPGQKLDPAVARYDEATALLRQGQAQAAAEKLASALRSPDIGLQSKAYYNRGNALVGMTQQEEQQGQLDMATKALDEALAMYENAMTLAPQDEDAKINYELALKKKQELEQKKQQQEQQQDQQKDQSKDQNKQDQQKQQEQEKEQEQQKQNEQNQPQEQQPQQAQPSQAMTQQEAAMLLDAMKQEEQASRDRLRLIIGQPVPVEKDW
ncbi:MAG: hypothetical protein V1873_00380 [Verrucomicrobiota bacterium]